MNIIEVSSKNVIYASKILFALNCTYPECDKAVKEISDGLFSIAVYLADSPEPISFSVSSNSLNRIILKETLTKAVGEYEVKDEESLPIVMLEYPTVYY